MAPRTPKVTRLDDNAEIYKRRELKSEREKLSEMDFAGKVEYFKNYYLAKLLAGLVIVGLITWILITIFTPKKEVVLNVSMINYPIDLNDIEQMTSDMNEILEVDTETQKIFFDTGFDLLNGDLASYEKLSTLLIVGEIDIFIAPELEFLKYGFSNALVPLDEAFSATDIEKISTKNQLFSCKTRLDDEELPQDALGDEKTFGIYIQDLPMFDYFTKDYIKDNPPVLGIVYNGKNRENSIKFVEYLLNTTSNN